MRFCVITTILLACPSPGQAQRKDLLLPAATLAPPNQQATRPTPGKWWLKNDARTSGGDILMTGEVSREALKPGEWQVIPASRFVAYRVPALVVDPKVTGWHWVYVGLLNEEEDPHSRVLARLSTEPYSEYLQAPQETKEKTTEVYWKAADLSDKQIVLEQPPAPMQHPGRGWYAGITHVKLVPMSSEQVAAAKKEIELPPLKQRLFGMLDYTDEVFWWGTVESEDDIRAIVYRHKESGFGRVYWRCFGSSLDNSMALPEATPRWTEQDDKQWCRQQKCERGWMPYINLTRRFDPLQVAVDYGKEHECEVHAWVRFTNFNRGPYANFWHDNRKFAAQMVAAVNDPKTGKRQPIKPYQYRPYPRVLSLAYPEVRAFYVRFFKQIAASGTRGIMIDLLRHPPIAGYEPIVRDAFKKKYGVDMETLDVYHDPLVQEHLSEYLRLFLVDLRKEIGKDIEISVRSSGPSKYALSGKEWIDQGLIDTIVDGNWYSGNGPRPTIAATVAAAGNRGKAYAIAETLNVDPDKGWGRKPGWLSPAAILALARQYSGHGVARFGLYESTIFTWYPDMRRAIRLAGWEFDPRLPGR